MHAASVHPEPGSNSRMFVFNLAYASSNHFECYLSFSYFCLSCICSLRNFRVPFLHILLCLYFSLRCSIFNDRFAALFRDSFVIISHLFPFVNTFFKSFSTFFKMQFRFPFLGTACPLYHITFPLSIPFFNFFEIFLEPETAVNSKYLACYKSRFFRSQPKHRFGNVADTSYTAKRSFIAKHPHIFFGKL